VVVCRYAGVEPEALQANPGNVGDSFGNALAETIYGLYKSEVINRGGLWRNFEPIEFATLERGGWVQHSQASCAIGNIPPAEADARCYAQIEQRSAAA
jgi:putative transposase